MCAERKGGARGEGGARGGGGDFFVNNQGSAKNMNYKKLGMERDTELY